MFKKTFYKKGADPCVSPEEEPEEKTFRTTQNYGMEFLLNRKEFINLQNKNKGSFSSTLREMR